MSPLQYGANYRGWPAFAAKVTGGPDRVATRDFAWAAHTVIGNDVWLGNHVVVVDGVTIGDGAVVGVGSVVTRDVPPYAVVAGAPARILRYRFPEPVIERLLAVAWWRYSMTDFGDVDFSDVGRCLDRIEDLIAADAIRPYAPGTVGSDAIRRGCKPA